MTLDDTESAALAGDPAGPLGERIGVDALRFVRRLPASPERVWRALTTADGLAAWLGHAVVVEMRPGGKFEVALSSEDRMDGRVIECEPHRRLLIAWHETSNGASAPYGTQPGDTSEVSTATYAAARR